MCMFSRIFVIIFLTEVIITIATSQPRLEFPIWNSYSYNRLILKYKKKKGIKNSDVRHCFIRMSNNLIIIKSLLKPKPIMFCPSYYMSFSSLFNLTYEIGLSSIIATRGYTNDWIIRNRRMWSYLRIR
jgi:hypothetical protein